MATSPIELREDPGIRRDGKEDDGFGMESVVGEDLWCCLCAYLRVFLFVFV